MATFGEVDAPAAAQRLNAETGELILVGAENGLYVQYLEAPSSLHPVRYVARAGVRRLRVKSGLGWVLLAQEDAAQVEQVYRGTMATDANRAEQPPSLEELGALLAQVRRQGYAFSRNLFHKGVGVLAATFPARAQVRDRDRGADGADRGASGVLCRPAAARNGNGR